MSEESGEEAKGQGKGKSIMARRGGEGEDEDTHFSHHHERRPSRPPPNPLDEQTTHNSTARSNRRANERSKHTNNKRSERRGGKAERAAAKKKTRTETTRKNKCGRREEGKNCFSFGVLCAGIKPVLYGSSRGKKRRRSERQKRDAGSGVRSDTNSESVHRATRSKKL